MRAFLPLVSLLIAWPQATAVASMPVAIVPTPRAVPSPVERMLAQASGLRRDVLERAMLATSCADQRGDAAPPTLTVIDFSLPSTAKRMWVFDLASHDLRFEEHVAHGQGTGDDLARAFSNTDGSHQSSLGVFRTAETYVGKHGRSLRLDGLEPGFNDRARQRAIVIHGADYVSETFIASHGRLGRSWGCPAVRTDVIDPLIDTIAGGGLVFAWYPEDEWLDASAYLNCEPGSP